MEAGDPPFPPVTLSHPTPNRTHAHTQVTNGKNAMPAWAGQLSPEEIESVAAYVYKQATTDGW